MNFLSFLNSIKLRNNFEKENAKKIIFYLSKITKNEMDLISNRNKNIDFKIHTFNRLFKKTLDGMPIEYIIKQKYFINKFFDIKKNIFIPRVETENEILNLINEKNNFLNILDLCSGCGIIDYFFQKKWPKAKITCVENNKRAINLFKKNVVSRNVSILKKNFFKLNYKSFDWESFDFVFFNPPYIDKIDKKKYSLKYDQKSALYAKKNGLEFYQYFFENYFHYFKKNTKFLIEIGFNQKDNLIQILKDKEILNFYFKKDIFNNDRFILINF